MASYMVLEPGIGPSERTEKAVLIRDGFAVLAFIVPFLWFLFHRMWLEAFAVLALSLSIAALGMQPGFAVLTPILSLLLSFLIGLEAQALRAAALRRRGWVDWGLVEAGNRNEAEARYVAEAAARIERAAPPPVPLAPVAGKPRPRTATPAFGLLDYPRRT
ncbi:DUF2628 domain-containing protein [Chelativorans sp. M5D2P16]|uniref:DUF2628 domain-containing protein n=1 Tax=Chelativorans sp. M5D2P16 TaxID=3095678 RepID=UPI002ACACF88|nr:DUF2628 domain-containing protein [Chelativorans sp. M5D2P16]MDZ5697394.1 DUF2628 domain-containing protein [Chelativorans sp. M5D2P16]